MFFIRSLASETKSTEHIRLFTQSSLLSWLGDVGCDRDCGKHSGVFGSYWVAFHRIGDVGSGGVGFSVCCGNRGSSRVESKIGFQVCF